MSFLVCKERSSVSEGSQFFSSLSEIFRLLVNTFYSLEIASLLDAIKMLFVRSNIMSVVCLHKSVNGIST